MGVNVLGPKKIRKLRETTGANVDRAITQSHGHRDGNFIYHFRVVEDNGTHWHGAFFVKHGMWVVLPEHPRNHWSSCRALELGLKANTTYRVRVNGGEPIELRTVGHDGSRGTEAHQ